MKPLWRPLDPDCIADPYPMYKRLREQDPVHRSQTGEWIITRYEDVKSILRNNTFLVGNRMAWLSKGVDYFENKKITFGHINEAIGDFILFLNPPDHSRIRKFIMKAWRQGEIENIINENLEVLLRSIRGTSFDLIEAISSPLPAMTISKLMGIPIQHYAYLKKTSQSLIKALDLYVTLRDIKKIDEAAAAFLLYFRKLVDEKRANPDDKIISRLIQFNQEEGTLTEKELISSCILLFVAGEETSVGLTGTGLMHLIQHEETWEKIKAHRSLIPSAIEELLRFDAPAQFVGRISSIDYELEGKVIKKGSTLTLCIAAANRDPLQFSKPNDLILERSPNQHLSFGGGAHYCLGDWLAKTQTHLAIESILERFKKLEVIDKRPNWNKNISVRSLMSLHVGLRD